MEINEYNKMLDLVNSIEDLDDALISALSEESAENVRIFDENGEKSVPYNTFLQMFDEQGLAAFC